MTYKNKDIFGTAPVLKVHLMGMPYAVLPDGEIVKFRMDNTVLFLAYLVMNPKRIFHRSELASLFYPDHDDLHASQNIRQVIFRLRKVLKDEDRKVPALLVDSVTIRVNPVGPLRSDAHQFSERIIETLQFIRQHPHRRSDLAFRQIPRLPVCERGEDAREYRHELSRMSELYGRPVGL